jgi:hypothetical protein
MFGSAFTIDPASLPRPGDPERARLGIERWRDQLKKKKKDIHALQSRNAKRAKPAK